MKQKTLLTLLTVAFSVCTSSAQVAHFDMSLTDGRIAESVTHSSYVVESKLPACNVEGLDGQALRFDGYSNYVRAALPATLSGDALTMRVVLAAESYPMMQVDVAETTPTFATICGNYDASSNKGLSLLLSSQGDLRVACGLVNGTTYRSVTLSGNKKLERGRWNIVTITVSKADRLLLVYLNGVEIARQGMSSYSLAHSTTPFYIGKDATEVKSGPFLINTFCGLIDDIAFYNSVQAPAAFTPVVADFNYPAERYAESLWRPQFHGMPSGGWTNESHGMTYSDGRYHVFFQKNANGPYMSRLHWGHISSADLCQWTDEPIAIYPGESYDLKGCWSGCVYESGADTYIIYTAVDNAKARIVQAKATDATLADWQKLGILIDGRPSGLSDDFRDPYYFEANGQKYIIVGTSKNNIGACTLHRLNGTTWTNDGSIFFQGTTASQHGTFWEMPNLTPMGDGRWLFTCTPLNTSAGVRTLCWVGTIGTDGRFTPDANGVQYLEMAGISRQGYGLLSPTIYQKDGKTLLLGIVPDKLPTQNNYEMGWAHNYSLPREVSLNASGQLVQRPYSGLTAMRTSETVSVNENLLGTEPLVSGRHLELLGEFNAVSGTCGFRFLKNASLTYNAATRVLRLDLTGLQRTTNDNGVYNGIYEATVPEALKKLHVFLDGSILDIFVNDRWAYSVRVFPTNPSATAAEVFATAETAVSVSAWVLDAGLATDITEIEKSPFSTLDSQDIYDLQGRRLQGRPQRGLYIQNGKKYVAR